MMILAFLLAGLTYCKVITVWEVALISCLNGMAMAINHPSFQAMVPRLVKREDLTNAIALNSAQFNMSRILGPTLGGYAMALLGMAGNFFLNGLSFLAVLWSLTRIRYPAEKAARHESMLTSLRAGFSYVRHQPQMRVLVAMISLSSLLLIPIFTFIPYFVRTQLGAGESGLGWIMACSGTGAVLGAIIVAWQGQIRHRGAVITFSGVLVMAAVMVFCYSRSFVLSEALMFVEGFGTILTISSVNVAMQHLSSDEMRGRVVSIYGTCFMGLPPLGALLAGELSRYIPTAHTLSAMSGIAMVTFLGFFTFSRALRELD
jgi:predicted MFS family arabinose efflux permease